jgi:4,5:9,10-diseco-3-hydroxy-5,9,17-trioxoandrosta-1(10),2-diene-4-oate hydrolase
VEQYRLALCPGFVDASLAALRSVIDVSGQHEMFLHLLSQLTMPTQIIWGENDAVLPVSQGQHSMGLLPNGRLTVIPDCGHLPHVEQPKLFVDAVTDFVLKTPSSRSGS